MDRPQASPLDGPGPCAVPAIAHPVVPAQVGLDIVISPRGACATSNPDDQDPLLEDAVETAIPHVGDGCGLREMHSIVGKSLQTAPFASRTIRRRHIAASEENI